MLPSVYQLSRLPGSSLVAAARATADGSLTAACMQLARFMATTPSLAAAAAAEAATTLSPTVAPAVPTETPLPPFSPRLEEQQAGSAKVPQGPAAQMLTKYRSTYPASVWQKLADLLGNRAGSQNVAVDVGIGTGRGAVELAKRGFRVTAIETGTALLGQTTAQAMACNVTVNALSAKAAKTQLKDATVDLVTVFHGLHLVELEPALVEVRRLLKPDRYFAAAWNDRDLSQPFVQQLEDLLEAHNPHYQRSMKQRDPERWQPLLTQGGGLQMLDFSIHTNPIQLRSPNAAYQLMTGLPYIQAILNGPDSHTFDNKLRRLIEQHYGQRAFDYPLQTKLYILQRST